MSPRHAIAILAIAATTGLADDPLQTKDEARPKRLELMREQAAATKVVVEADEKRIEPELVAEPLMRYDDQPRRFVDATLWLWTHEKRPVAVCKVEDDRRIPGKPAWQWCLSSLAGSRVAVTWPNGQSWESRAAIEYRVIPDGPVPADSPRLRLTQMKALARRFSAVMIILQDRQSMRLLPTPIHRYEAPNGGVRDAALFAVTANGLNPDCIVIIELVRADTEQAVWRYAVAPVTADAMELQLDNQTVWTKQSTLRVGGDTVYHFTEPNPNAVE